MQKSAKLIRQRSDITARLPSSSISYTLSSSSSSSSSHSNGGYRLNIHDEHDENLALLFSAQEEGEEQKKAETKKRNVNTWGADLADKSGRMLVATAAENHVTIRDLFSSSSSSPNSSSTSTSVIAKLETKRNAGFEVICVAFSNFKFSNKQLIATGGEKNSVLLFSSSNSNSSSFPQVCKIEGVHESSLTAVSFSETHPLLASGEKDHKIVIHLLLTQEGKMFGHNNNNQEEEEDEEDGEQKGENETEIRAIPLFVLQNVHGGAVRGISWSSSSQYPLRLASCGHSDKLVVLFKLFENKKDQEETLLLASSSSSASSWTPRTVEQVAEHVKCAGHTKFVNDVVFAHPPPILRSEGEEENQTHKKELKEEEEEEGEGEKEEANEKHQQENEPRFCAVSCGEDSCRFWSWDGRTTHFAHLPQGISSNCLNLSFDNKVLAVGTDVGMIYIFDCASGQQLIQKPLVHSSDSLIRAIKFSADSCEVVSQDQKGSLKCFSTGRGGRLLCTLPDFIRAGSEKVDKMSVSEDGLSLLVDLTKFKNKKKASSRHKVFDLTKYAEASLSLSGVLLKISKIAFENLKKERDALLSK